MRKLGAITTYKDVESLSIGQALERSRYIAPRKTCVFFKEEGLTYKQLDDQSTALAVGLQEMGIKKGDRVGIYMFNRPESVHSILRASKAGGRCRMDKRRLQVP